MKLTMKLIKFVVILFCLFHSFANCDRLEFNKDGPFASSDWLQIVDNFLGQNFPDFLIGLTYKNISESCRTQTRNFAEKINNEKSLTSNLDNTFWHLKMLDSSAQLHEGILNGNLIFLGNYQSCLDVNVEGYPENGTTLEGFRGRYVSLVFNIASKPSIARTWNRLDFDLHRSQRSKDGQILIPTVLIGLCLPSSCSEEQIAGGVQSIIDDSQLLANVSVTVSVWSSHSKADVWHYDGYDIAMIVFTCCIGVLLLIGTGLDIWIIYKPTSVVPKTPVGKLLLGFSLYKNTKVLFSISNKSNPDHLLCLNGIRSISITWVILGHVYIGLTSHPSNTNVPYSQKLTSSYWFQAVTNAFPSVDSFFVLGGCLLAYLTLKELDKTKGRVNWIMLIVHRYLRLTGMLAYVIFFHATLLRALEGGPMDLVPMGVNNCRESWWKHLLYFTNFDSEITCIGQTWYLDNDMQMLLVSPFIIYPLWRLKKIGVYMTLVWVVASCLVPFSLTIYYDWPPSPIIEMPSLVHYSEHNYQMPWCRFSPYVWGILLGYALHVTKKKQFKISKELNIILWTGAFVMGYMVVYGLNLPEYFAGTIPSGAVNAAYGGFHRLAWGVALSWLIFACCRGYGGWINQFLSWEGWEPLARLSYNIYLVHMTVMFWLIGKKSFTVAMTDLESVMFLLNVTVISALVSAALFICIEVPWANTEKLLFSLILGGTSKPKTK